MQCMVTWMLLTEITPTLYCSAFVFLPIIPLKTACCLNDGGIQCIVPRQLVLSHPAIWMLSTEITPTLYCSAFVFLPIIPLKTACCLNDGGIQCIVPP